MYYTQGFNPHIYLSFTCPLSLGQESLCESCEVKTEQETIDPQAWIDALQPLMPRGIVITKVAPAVEKVGGSRRQPMKSRCPPAQPSPLTPTTMPSTPRSRKDEARLQNAGAVALP